MTHDWKLLYYSRVGLQTNGSEMRKHIPFSDDDCDDCHGFEMPTSTVPFEFSQFQWILIHMSDAVMTGMKAPVSTKLAPRKSIPPMGILYLIIFETRKPAT